MDDVNDDAKTGFLRIEALTGPTRRRRWPDDEKGCIVVLYPPTPPALAVGLTWWRSAMAARFLGNDRFEIDIDTVERSMRPIALNRKNAMFADSDEGAPRRAAVS